MLAMSNKKRKKTPGNKTWGLWLRGQDLNLRSRLPPRSARGRAPPALARPSGYYEAVQETFGQQGILPVRLWPLIASFPGTLWQDSQHPERMERAKARLGYYRRRDTPAYYAALFLLTSSAELWRRTANCFYRQGFEPAYADRRGISLQDYALLSAARDLYGGTVPTAQDLPNRDLVDDEALRLIVNATLIARYGLPALDIRERRSQL